jgi:hypothetical protein
VTYRQWSHRWAKEREYSGRLLSAKEVSAKIERVKTLWDVSIPCEWERENWTFLTTEGFRRKPGLIPQPEHELEKAIFARDKWTIKSEQGMSFVSPRLNEISFAKHKQGQRKIDVLAVLKTGDCQIPLAIEVKKTTNNCWFAVVENLQQLKLLRAYPQKRLQNHPFLAAFKNLHLPASTGMVLAPMDFFYHQGQKYNSFCHAQELIHELRTHCGITVLLGAFSEGEQGQIKVLGSSDNRAALRGK